MDRYDVLVHVIMAMIFATVIMVFLDVAYEKIAEGEVCQNIGMDRFRYIMDETYCIDHNNDAHLVDINCQDLLWNKQCQATVITIGEFRVREVVG